MIDTITILICCISILVRSIFICCISLLTITQSIDNNYTEKILSEDIAFYFRHKESDNHLIEMLTGSKTPPEGAVTFYTL